MANMFGGGAKTAATTATQALGIQFTSSQYGPPVPVVYGTGKVGGNCIWYGDFKSVAHSQKVGKGGGSSTSSYTYTASFQMALCEGPISGVRTVYSGTSTVILSSIGAVIANGTVGQAAWSHLSGGFALGYSQTALFSVQNLNLGSSASLPNYNYEVQGILRWGSSDDANPADVLTDICTNATYGISFPWLGSLTQYSNYCLANNLLLSPVYDQEQTGQQTLEDLFKYTNTAAWFSEGVLKTQPYGDTAVTGNGVTYTPNVTPLFDLGEADYIVTPGEAPISVTRKAPANCMNMVRVEYQDRSNTYHTSVVVASIDEDVLVNGGRADDTESVDMCKTSSVARFIAQNLVQSAFYIRNTYEFKLSWRYCMLEPMDIVTLTDVNTGLNLTPVRITEVSEDESGVLSITAEEFPEGIGHSAIYNTQPNNGGTIDPNSDPGAVNPPYLFRGPGFLVSNNTPEIWCAVSGPGALWGGADIYLSHDGTSYSYMGTTAQPARYGALATALATGSDPDTTNTPTVQLYSPAQLLGSSQSDADNLVTLAMVDTEIISYETATLVGTEEYQLSYMRRGAYGSAIASHTIGAPWVRLDDAIFRIPVDPSQIGQTVYIKFLSLNVFGRTPRTLASETAYTYVVGTNVELPDVPPVPASFGTQGVADGVSITWNNSNPSAVGCTSIERSTVSTGPFSVIAQVGPTTTGYTDHFTDGSLYYYRARARGPLVSSGWSGYTAVFNSSGTNVNAISTVANQANTTAQNLNMVNLSMVQGLLGWTCSNSNDTANWYAETGANGPNGGTSNYIVHHTSAFISQLNNTFMPCQPGAVIKASGQVRGVGGPNGIAGIYIAFYDINRTYISSPNSNYVTGNGQWTLVLTAIAPSNAAFVTIGPTVGSVSSGAVGYFTWANFTWNYAPASVDEVPDGSSYARTKSASLTNGVPPPYGSGKNMIGNPTFVSNAMGIATGVKVIQGSYLCDGWQVHGYSDASSSAIYENGAGALVGFHPFLSFTSASASLPGSTNWVIFINAQKFGTAPTSPYVLYMQYRADANVSPSGVNRYVRMAVQWFNAAGTLLSETTLDNLAAVTGTLSVVRGTVEAPSSAAYGIPYCGGFLNNTNSTAYAIAGNAPFDLRIVYFGVYAQASLDDEVGDGATYSKVKGVAMTAAGTGIPFAGAYTQNCVTNPNFMNNKLGVSAGITATGSAASNMICDDWRFGQNDGGVFISSRETGQSPPGGGSTDLLIRLQQNQPLADNAGYGGYVYQTGLVPVNGRDRVIVSGYMWSASSVALATGMLGVQYIGVDWLDANGGLISSSNAVATRTGSSQINSFVMNSYTPPSNATQFRVSCGSQVFTNQAGHTAVNTGANLYHDARFNAIRVVLAAQNQADLPQRTVTNITAKVPSSISYSATTTTATISVTAMAVLAGSITVNYGATSVGVSGTSGSTVTYYLYYDDQNYAGGSPALVATTSGNDLYASDARVFVGSVDVTYPTSGTGGGTSGGGGSQCVTEDSWVWALRGKREMHIQAKDLRAGDYLRIMSPSRGRARWGQVTKTERSVQPCAIFRTRKGVELEASLSARIGIATGQDLAPLDLKGAKLLINRRGKVRLDRVVYAERIGRKNVVAITCEDDFFLAGKNKHEYVCHHNLKKLP